MTFSAVFQRWLIENAIVGSVICLLYRNSMQKSTSFIASKVENTNSYQLFLVFHGLFSLQIACFLEVAGAQAFIFSPQGWYELLNRFFFQKEKQQLTCSHRTLSACLASPDCVFVETSAECCEHPSPAAWRGLPVSFHQDAMKQGTYQENHFHLHHK